MVFCSSEKSSPYRRNEVPPTNLAKANFTTSSLHFACSRRMHFLALKVQFGLQSVQELLQGVCEFLGLISRRWRRRKKSLSDLGTGRERDEGARVGRFYRHDRRPLGWLETSGSTLASSPLQIVKY